MATHTTFPGNVSDGLLLLFLNISHHVEKMLIPILKLMTCIFAHCIPISFFDRKLNSTCRGHMLMHFVSWTKIPFWTWYIHLHVIVPRFYPLTVATRHDGVVRETIRSHSATIFHLECVLQIVSFDGRIVASRGHLIMRNISEHQDARASFVCCSVVRSLWTVNETGWKRRA